MTESSVEETRNVISLPAREVAVAASVDVLVAGGGPAGFGAALAAARQGASTLLVERDAILGGVATAGGMNTWNVPPECMTGVAQELTRRLIQEGAAVAGDTVPFDVEATKELILNLLLEAGAQVLTYTWVVEPLLEQGRVTGALIVNKSGLQAVRARVVVDATGDADLAAAAGAPMVKGRESDGKMRPMSVLFRLGGVDVLRLVEYCRQHPERFTPEGTFQILKPEAGLVRVCGFFDLIKEARERGELDGDVNYIRFEGVQVERGIVTVNNSRVYGYDGTNGWDLTRADIAARRQNRQLFALVKKHVPGCENSYVLDSTTIAVRETRRARGSHVLTEEDIAANRTYADTVARIWRRHAAGTDGHSPDGGEGRPGDIYHSATSPLVSFEVPYRVLVPNGVEGLLVAGRTLSQTQPADMFTRGQYACMVTGQAAGTAAALAAKAGVAPRQVDVRKLQEALVQSGVDIGDAAEVIQVARVRKQ